LALSFLLEYIHTSRLVYAVWASIFSGLTLAAKYNTLPLLVVTAVVILRHRSDSHSKAKIALAIGAAMVVGFLAGAPNWLFHPLGNINMFFSDFALGGSLYQPLTPNHPIHVFIFFLKDVVGQLGWVVAVLLVIAVIVNVIFSDWKGRSLVGYILLYILFTCLLGYYANHFTLMIFPVMVLLVGKLLFFDVARFIESRKPQQLQPLRPYVLLLVWGFFAFYALDHVVLNIKTFNLLKTQDEWSRTIEYRQQHNLDGHRYFIGRQLFTPRIEGWNIKLTGGFTLRHAGRFKKKKLHFIQGHWPSYRRYLEQEEKELDAIDLKGYRPFYIIEKRQYQSWNPQSVFLYPVADALFFIQPGEKVVHLPRIFYPAPSTSFLPLQIYEKNPNFIKLDGHFYQHWLYSKKELQGIVVWMFSLQRHNDLTIHINHKKAEISSRYRSPVERVELSSLTAGKGFYDFVYSLEFHSTIRDLAEKPYYLVLEPVYAAGVIPAPSPLKFPQKARGNVPDLFSKEEYPLWTKLFYKETGIDLALLTLLTTHTLYENPGQDVQDISLDYYPLEKGYYSIRLEGEKLIANQPYGMTAFLEYTYYSDVAGNRVQIPLKGRIPFIERIDIPDSMAFIKIIIRGQAQNNMVIKNISITPNYKRFFNQKLVKTDTRARGNKKKHP